MRGFPGRVQQGRFGPPHVREDLVAARLVLVFRLAHAVPRGCATFPLQRLLALELEFRRLLLALSQFCFILLKIFARGREVADQAPKQQHLVQSLFSNFFLGDVLALPNFEL